MKIIVFTFLVFANIFVSSIFVGQEVYAQKVNESCSKVELIFARGSGSGFDNDEYNVFKSQITDRLNGAISLHTYQLGTEKYNGNQYPAVGVGNVWNGNPIGAYTSAGMGNDYGNSVVAGTIELKSYLSQRYEKCKNSGTYYILGGHSQGAQVIGQTLSNIPVAIRDRIIFVALTGDPKLYFPEGEGFFLNPPACQGKKLSVYRRGVNSCTLIQGRLGARKPYLPKDMEAKTGLWCYKNDYVCGTSNNPWASGHGTYAVPGSAIDKAAQEAVTRLQDVIDNEPVSPHAPPKPAQLPIPEPDIGDLIDTTYHLGMGQNGQDILFVIDMSYYMGPFLYDVNTYLRDTIPKIMANGGHATIASYCSVQISPDVFMTTAGAIPFELNPLTYLDLMTQRCGYDHSSDVNYVLNASLNRLNWRDGAAKSVVLFTNSKYPIVSPDAYGTTKALLAKTALNIDPVNIYPVVGKGSSSDYYELADLTSGQVVTFDDDISEAAGTAYMKIQNRPAPFLKNTEYIADPGQEITFDASDSYVVNSNIVKYDWDFDGDSLFDATTTGPSIEHTYNQKFDGTMQVRVTSASGLIATASATVKIGTYVPPTIPAAPTNLTATVTHTDNDFSTVHLTWDRLDYLATGWSLSVNGVPLGTIAPGQTSIDVTDVDRSIDVDFGIAGVTDEPLIGQYAVTTLAVPQPLVDSSDNSVVHSDTRNSATPVKYTKPNAVLVSTSADGSASSAVLGLDIAKRFAATTANGDATQTVAKQNITGGFTGKIFGLMWYWWLPIAGLVGGVAWWRFGRTGNGGS